ncbi:alpha/beta fold hydrolase [Microbacterium sp.]|uniref:alpha/beta fold hydrolase n=1 Tax=Microbacterium sp. TaxID=51671 RepID=UPI003A8BB21C
MVRVDEFQFLSGQAAGIGVSGIPVVQRLTHRLSCGRTLSALRYGDAPPRVVFLHGAGLNAHTWDVTVLAAGVPALAVDLAGHGDSSWRDDADYAPRVLSPDIAEALAAWAPERLLVVGHSLGGLTAAALAAENPALADALVIVDITPGATSGSGAASLREFFAGPTDWATRDELVDRALAFGLGGDRAAATRGVFHNSRIRTDGRVEWKHHFAHLAARLAAHGDDGTPPRPRSDGWDDLTGVRCPITLVRGTRGFVTEAHRDEFVRRVPHATVVEFDSGHNVQEEQPVALGRLVARLASPDAAVDAS